MCLVSGFSPSMTFSEVHRKVHQILAKLLVNWAVSDSKRNVKVLPGFKFQVLKVSVVQTRRLLAVSRKNPSFLLWLSYCKRQMTENKNLQGNTFQSNTSSLIQHMQEISMDLNVITVPTISHCSLSHSIIKFPHSEPSWGENTLPEGLAKFTGEKNAWDISYQVPKSGKESTVIRIKRKSLEYCSCSSRL